MNILAVVAHPDDEVLGCGGTIIRHARAGDDVHILILGEGATSRYDDRTTGPAADEVTRLAQQAQSAAKVLKSRVLPSVGLPDQRFDSVDLLDVIKPVEQAIDQLQPHVVYTHFWGDLNNDHRLTCQAVVTACRPGGENPVERLIACEVLSSTHWPFAAADSAFQPNTFVTLDHDDINVKLEAIKCYENELRDAPHPRSRQGIETLARHRGHQIGKPFAEAFMLIREVRS